MLTREIFIGPWAGLPVAWTDDDRFDEQTYRQDVARCCEAGVPGVYSGGTTGEFYAMEFEEFKAVARATVEECRSRNTPCMIGCSSTYTLGAIRRAKIARELGAECEQVDLDLSEYAVGERLELRRACDANGCIGLVDRPVRFDARRGLLQAAAAEKPGRPIVARLRIELHV